MADPVNQEINCWMVEYGRRVEKLRTVWSWDPDDEFVVAVGFFAPCGSSTRWEFDWQLVLKGVDDVAGEGDVLIARTGKLVSVRLESPDGIGTYELPHRDVRTFARRMRRALPAPRLPEDAALADVMADWSAEASRKGWL